MIRINLQKDTVMKIEVGLHAAMTKAFEKLRNRRWHLTLH